MNVEENGMLVYTATLNIDGSEVKVAIANGELSSETVTVNDTVYTLTLDTDTDLVTATGTINTAASTETATGFSTPAQDSTETYVVMSETAAIEIGGVLYEVDSDSSVFTGYSIEGTGTDTKKVAISGLSSDSHTLVVGSTSYLYSDTTISDPTSGSISFKVSDTTLNFAYTNGTFSNASSEVGNYTVTVSDTAMADGTVYASEITVTSTYAGGGIPSSDVSVTANTSSKLVTYKYADDKYYAFLMGSSAAQAADGTEAVDDDNLSINFTSGAIVAFSTNGSNWALVDDASISSAGVITFGSNADSVAAAVTSITATQSGNTITITPGAAQSYTGESAADLTKSYDSAVLSVSRSTVGGSQYLNGASNELKFEFTAPTYASGVSDSVSGQTYGLEINNITAYTSEQQISEYYATSDSAGVHHWTGTINVKYNGETVTFGTGAVNLTTFLGNSSSYGLSTAGQLISLTDRMPMTMSYDTDKKTYTFATAADGTAYTGALLSYDDGKLSYYSALSTSSGAVSENNKANLTFNFSTTAFSESEGSIKVDVNADGTAEWVTTFGTNANGNSKVAGMTSVVSDLSQIGGSQSESVGAADLDGYGVTVGSALAGGSLSIGTSVADGGINGTQYMHVGFSSSGTLGAGITSTYALSSGALLFTFGTTDDLGMGHMGTAAYKFNGFKVGTGGVAYADITAQIAEFGTDAKSGGKTRAWLPMVFSQFGTDLYFSFFGTSGSGMTEPPGTNQLGTIYTANAQLGTDTGYGVFGKMGTGNYDNRYGHSFYVGTNGDISNIDNDYWLGMTLALSTGSGATQFSTSVIKAGAYAFTLGTNTYVAALGTDDKISAVYTKFGTSGDDLYGNEETEILSTSALYLGTDGKLGTDSTGTAYTVSFSTGGAYSGLAALPTAVAGLGTAAGSGISFEAAVGSGATIYDSLTVQNGTIAVAVGTDDKLLAVALSTGDNKYAVLGTSAVNSFTFSTSDNTLTYNGIMTYQWTTGGTYDINGDGEKNENDKGLYVSSIGTAESSQTILYDLGDSNGLSSDAKYLSLTLKNGNVTSWTVMNAEKTALSGLTNWTLSDGTNNISQSGAEVAYDSTKTYTVSNPGAGTTVSTLYSDVSAIFNNVGGATTALLGTMALSTANVKSSLKGELLSISGMTLGTDSAFGTATITDETKVYKVLDSFVLGTADGASIKAEAVYNSAGKELANGDGALYVNESGSLLYDDGTTGTENDVTMTLGTNGALSFNKAIDTTITFTTADDTVSGTAAGTITKVGGLYGVSSILDEDGKTVTLQLGTYNGTVINANTVLSAGTFPTYTVFRAWWQQGASVDLEAKNVIDTENAATTTTAAIQSAWAKYLALSTKGTADSYKVDGGSGYTGVMTIEGAMASDGTTENLILSYTYNDSVLAITSDTSELFTFDGSTIKSGDVTYTLTATDASTITISSATATLSSLITDADITVTASSTSAVITTVAEVTDTTVVAGEAGVGFSGTGIEGTFTVVSDTGISITYSDTTIANGGTLTISDTSYTVTFVDNGNGAVDSGDTLSLVTAGGSVDTSYSAEAVLDSSSDTPVEPTVPGGDTDTPVTPAFTGYRGEIKIGDETFYVATTSTSTTEEVTLYTDNTYSTETANTSAYNFSFIDEDSIAGNDNEYFGWIAKEASGTTITLTGVESTTETGTVNGLTVTKVNGVYTDLNPDDNIVITANSITDSATGVTYTATAADSDTFAYLASVQSDITSVEATTVLTRVVSDVSRCG